MFLIPPPPTLTEVGKMGEIFDKIVLERIDSNARSLGEVEYDNQNCHRHQKTQVWLKNLK
jgi:hypothetical protein